jgi:hypothetical protein
MCDSLQSSRVNPLHNSCTMMVAKRKQVTELGSNLVMHANKPNMFHIFPTTRYLCEPYTNEREYVIPKLSRLSKMSIYFASSSFTCIASLAHKPLTCKWANQGPMPKWHVAQVPCIWVNDPHHFRTVYSICHCWQPIIFGSRLNDDLQTDHHSMSSKCIVYNFVHYNGLLDERDDNGHLLFLNPLPYSNNSTKCVQVQIHDVKILGGWPRSYYVGLVPLLGVMTH